MTRLAIVAPQFPEYSLCYALGMSGLCTVLACVDEGQLAAEYAGRLLPEDRNGVLRQVHFKSPFDLLQLIIMIWRFKPDVLHIQEAAGPRRAFFTACLAHLFRRSALVVLTVHDPLPHAGRDQAAARRTAWIGRYVRRSADLIVTHGHHCAGLMQAQVRETKQQVVSSEHGLILEPPTLQPTPAAPIRLYLFGRMEAYKGVEVLLAAAELLHAEAFPFALTVAGSGPELDRLQHRFARLPEVEVFNGFVPPSQVIASIQAANCVLLPYLSATQSGVLAAAFAGRRCVIASNTGGLPDVIQHGHNGLLVPPGDPSALAAAIRKLALDDQLRSRLLAGAAATAAGQLDWRRISRVLCEVLTASATRRAARQVIRPHV